MSRQGRGRGFYRGGGRGRGPHPRSNSNTFKGETSGMSGHVYQLGKETNKRRQYTDTTQMLERYTTKNLKHFSDLLPLFDDKVETPVLNEPPDPTAKEEASKAKMRISTKRIDRYVERLDVLDGNVGASKRRSEGTSHGIQGLQIQV